MRAFILQEKVRPKMGQTDQKSEFDGLRHICSGGAILKIQLLRTQWVTGESLGIGWDRDFVVLMIEIAISDRSSGTVRTVGRETTKTALTWPTSEPEGKRCTSSC